MLVQENPPSLRDKFGHLFTSEFATSFVSEVNEKFFSQSFAKSGSKSRLTSAPKPVRELPRRQGRSFSKDRG